MFSGDSVTETLAAVLTRDPDLGQLQRTVPPPIVSLLRRCLERNPKKRLRDIGEARLILGDPQSAVRERRAMPLAGPAPSRWAPARRAIGAVTLVALGFAAGFGAASFGRRPAAVSSPFQSLSVTPMTASGNVISATISPDGRYMAYVESEQGRQSLWLQQVAGGQTLRLIPDQTRSTGATPSRPTATASCSG